MSNVDRLLVYYGSGKQFFGELVEDVLSSWTAETRTPLCEMMKRCGSDKGLGWHNYTVLYDALITRFLPDVAHVFELGLGTNYLDLPSNMGLEGVPGASLRGWRECFPNATVIGADIDRRILFEEPGIRTYYVDQTQPAVIQALWTAMPHIEFDLMIDDGVHEVEANGTFLTESIGKLKSQGLYIIEDIVLTMPNIAAFDEFLRMGGHSGFLMRMPFNDGNTVDNAVIVLASPRRLEPTVDNGNESRGRSLELPEETRQQAPAD